jgi:hypothetical protein
MQSKLTLRLDEDLKERVKQLANERGTSVSALVEQYFRILLREPVEGVPEMSGEGALANEEASLSPRIRELKENLGRPAPEVSMDDDTRRWVEVAAEKHA